MFAVLFVDLDGFKSINQLARPCSRGRFAQDLRDLCREIVIDDVRLRVSASIGIAVYPRDGLNVETCRVTVRAYCRQPCVTH